MPRRAILVFLLGCLAGCAKPPDLPEITVHASTAGELADFRTELHERFTAEQLQPFDTALKELQLDAMERGVATAAVREQVMLSAVNGKSVHDALVVGWQARRHRLLAQIELIAGLAEQNLKAQQETAATGTPDSVTTHLQNAREILVRLHRDLADTEHQLTEWGASPEPAATPKAGLAK
jgi:hypothetical protein